LPATSAIPPNSLIVSLGGANIGPKGRMLDAIRAGIPTLIFRSDVRAGKQVGLFYLYIVDGRFYCDFTIYPNEDISPIVIKHNQLTKPLPIGWDSNSNADALEIVNGQEPMFQMYYDGPNKIAINGILWQARLFFSLAV
jgi:hypothetical protein